jgi:hypothetical protein
LIEIIANQEIAAVWDLEDVHASSGCNGDLVACTEPDRLRAAVLLWRDGGIEVEPVFWPLPHRADHRLCRRTARNRQLARLTRMGDALRHDGLAESADEVRFLEAIPSRQLDSSRTRVA